MSRLAGVTTVFRGQMIVPGLLRDRFGDQGFVVLSTRLRYRAAGWR